MVKDLRIRSINDNKKIGRQSRRRGFRLALLAFIALLAFAITMMMQILRKTHFNMLQHHDDGGGNGAEAMLDNFVDKSTWSASKEHVKPMLQFKQRKTDTSRNNEARDDRTRQQQLNSLSLRRMMARQTGKQHPRSVEKKQKKQQPQQQPQQPQPQQQKQEQSKQEKQQQQKSQLSPWCAIPSNPMRLCRTPSRVDLTSASTSSTAGKLLTTSREWMRPKRTNSCKMCSIRNPSSRSLNSLEVSVARPWRSCTMPREIREDGP
mmetsp:Transcript_4115/g.9144  ORF Transcript_4115/g.9144 Transcript_4115/m.9144 type:complete len:263 (-) Transcript_4115:372-1160(-)